MSANGERHGRQRGRDVGKAAHPVQVRMDRDMDAGEWYVVPKQILRSVFTWEVVLAKRRSVSQNTWTLDWVSLMESGLSFVSRALLVLACGCSASTEDNSAGPRQSDSNRVAVPTAGTTVSAEQVEGVWVFSHDPDLWRDSYIEGVPMVENGCLPVSGAVVVWAVARLQEAKDLTSQLAVGEAPEMVTVGGGYDERVPQTIIEHCGDVPEVFLGTPE